MTESKFFCTLSNQNRTSINKEEIPHKTTYLNFSKNQIEKLDDDIFEENNEEDEKEDLIYKSNSK